MTTFDYEKINDAIRIWRNLEFTVEVKDRNFVVYRKDGCQLDAFKDGNELYTAAIFHQRGYYDAVVI